MTLFSVNGELRDMYEEAEGERRAHGYAPPSASRSWSATSTSTCGTRAARDGTSC